VREEGTLKLESAKSTPFRINAHKGLAQLRALGSSHFFVVETGDVGTQGEDSLAIKGGVAHGVALERQLVEALELPERPQRVQVPEAVIGCGERRHGGKLLDAV
jgi:hypothetical protein